jgi:hypothetical protein
MRTRSLYSFLTITLLVVVLSGCSVAVGHGRLNFFDKLEYVNVTNNTEYVGNVERNGELFGALGVGESCLVPFRIGPSVIIAFKAFDVNRKYIGVVEQTFYSRNRMGDNQSWVITYIQRPYR